MLLNKLTERMSQKVAGSLFCNDKDGPVLCNETLHFVVLLESGISTQVAGSPSMI